MYRERLNSDVPLALQIYLIFISINQDEVCDNYKLEPTVSVEEARIETGLGVQEHKRQQRSDMPAPLPPLPLESALFVPPVDRGNRKDKSLGMFFKCTQLTRIKLPKRLYRSQFTLSIWIYH